MTDGEHCGISRADPPSAEHGAEPNPAAAGARIDAAGWRRIRLAALSTYVAVLVGIVVFTGVPTGRQMIAVIVVSGLAITTIGSGWRAAGRVVLDWLPFSLVLVAYDQTRAFADTVGLPLHEADVLDWEKWLFFGHVPTVWLQQHLLDVHHVHWYDAAFTLIYTTHFFATPVLAAVLWLRNRTAWVRYISRVIVLSVLGLATYVLFPEAPPWMASRDGLITEHIARLSARGWIWLHAANLKGVLEHAQEDGSNPVAAMPSLHVGFACLCAVFLASMLRSKWRYLLVLYPLAMGTALVYQGEHYVVDLIAGAAYALAVHFGLNAWERHRAAKKAVDAARTPTPCGDPVPTATRADADPNQRSGGPEDLDPAIVP